MTYIQAVGSDEYSNLTSCLKGQDGSTECNQTDHSLPAQINNSPTSHTHSVGTLNCSTVIAVFL